MDQIEKALERLSDRERGWVKAIISHLKEGRLIGLNIQKLKGQKDIFRVKKGDVRIIYSWKQERLVILAVQRRSEKTYRNF